jgi:3-oxoadipate CoA-transferase beta subunit
MKPLSRHQIAWRAAQDLEEGTYVNLGLGMPTLVSNYKPEDRDFMFHSENGIVGVGPLASEAEADPDFVDAGSQKITLLPGSSISDSSMAFSMIRGGHVDVTLLGGFEVSETGDLANWDAKMTHKGQLVGGAMDLVAGAKSVRVTMQHTTKDGAPRLVEACSYPLTGVGVVDRVYTDLAVVDITPRGFLVREMVEGLTEEALQAKTGAQLLFDEPCGVLTAPAVG